MGNPNLKSLCTADPINNATGDLAEQQADLIIGGRGPGLHVVRTYNSFAAAESKESGPWGFGWTGSYDAKLEISGEKATVRQEGGNAVIFYKSGTGYTQGGWTQGRLAKSGENYIYTLPNQAKLEFNNEGRLTKETDRLGNSNTLTYNKSHQLEKVTDGDSRSLTFTYNKEGQVESVVDPMKHEIKYTYESGNLKSVTIEGKVRWEFEYESPHLLKKITDGRKHATTNEYDGSHRVIKQTIAGHERKFKYGSTPGTETTITEPNGSETVETFNVAGEPTKITRAKGITGVETTTEYEYEATTYALIKMIDGNKHVAKYGYDGEGNKTSETDASGDERKWKYNKTHDIETETTPEGETTTIERNSKGEPTKVERPIGETKQVTEYKYNEKGDLTEVTDPLKHAISYTYDAAGDKETETDAEGNERKWTYNADSQLIEEISPRKFATKIERNNDGFPTVVTNPLGHTVEYKYDGDSNLESATDANKHITTYEYNEENKLIKVKEPNETAIEIGYDSEGQMTSRTDGNKHTWEYKRNKLEQVVEEENPLHKIWKKKYDKAGNLETLEDPEKNLTEFSYDESNRPTKIKYATGKPSEVTYEYNKDSKVKKMTDETGTTENTWDKLDRLTKYASGAGKIVEYEYNLANLPTKITYPNKEHVTRDYDKDNRLEKVTDWKGNTTSFKYNADSELEKSTFPAASEDKDEYAYNEADQMAEVKMLKGATELGKLVYEHGGDGEVTKTTTKVLPGPEVNEVKYDANSRLVEANKKAYEYDNGNNPTEIEGVGSYKYNEADELTEGPEGTYAFSEDGRRTEVKPGKSPATTYSYDQAGNLTAVKRPEEALILKIEDGYTYDGNNLRQTQTINGTKSNLTWDTAEPSPLILEDETDSYVYGPGNVPIEQISTGGTVLYLHHDQQGSTRLLTNTSGSTEAAYTYSPYGALEATSGTATTPLRYDAQYTNTDTGLIYLRARTYDPTTAQFLTVDPALQATSEPYTYGRDNPLTFVDPSGKNVTVQDVGIATTGAGVISAGIGLYWTPIAWPGLATTLVGLAICAGNAIAGDP